MEISMIRRPLFFLFLFFSAGIGARYLFQGLPLMLRSLYLLPAAGAAGALLWLIRYGAPRSIGSPCPAGQAGNRALLLLLLCPVFLGGLTLCGRELDAEDPLAVQAGEKVTLVGQVLSAQQKAEDYHQFIVSTAAVPAENRDTQAADTGRKRRMLVRIFGALPEDTDLTGSLVQLRGELVRPDPRRNPGGFDYRLYLKTQGIGMILQADAGSISLLPADDSALSERVWGQFLRRLSAVFRHMESCLAAVLSPEQRGVLLGMVFGDKSLMEESLLDSFRQNGIAHILSVSGLHVGIVYAAVSRLTGIAGRRASGLLSLLILFLYAALAGFSPSVVRASLMIGLHILAGLLYRRYDLLTGVAAAATLMLLYQPLQLFHAGFQLSFLAVISLAFLLPFLQRFVDMSYAAEHMPLRLALFRAAAPVLAIQTGLAPLTAFLFHSFSVAAFFLNIPVIFLAGFLVPVGVLLIPLSALTGAGNPGILFSAVAAAGGGMTDWLTGLSRFSSTLPGNSFTVISPPGFLLILFYLLLFFGVSETFRILWQRRKCRAAAGIWLFLLCCALMTAVSPLCVYDRSALIFVDVGQGDCLHIRTPEGKNMLIDGGGSLNYEVGRKTLLPYLLKNGVGRIDLALATHLHTDHYQGICELAREIPIDRLAVYEGNRLRQEELIRDTGIPAERIPGLSAGQTVQAGRDVTISVLFPEKQEAEQYRRIILEEEDENRSSLVVQVRYQGLTVLMTGDLGFEGEGGILRKIRRAGRPDLLQSDILKVGHHGSRYSTGDEFLQAVSPSAAVFQVGKNHFGHPHPTVLEKCEKQGIMIYRNDRQGAVTVKIGGDGRARIQTMIEPENR